MYTVAANQRRNRYIQRKLAKGLCSRCIKPVDPASKYMCTQHLMIDRNRKRQSSHSQEKDLSQHEWIHTPYVHKFMCGLTEYDINSYPSLSADPLQELIDREEQGEFTFSLSQKDRQMNQPATVISLIGVPHYASTYDVVRELYLAWVHQLRRETDPDEYIQAAFMARYYQKKLDTLMTVERN